MNPEQSNRHPSLRNSTVPRNGRWRPTVNPIERAELFGQLLGVASAKSAISDATTITKVVDILSRLEVRYAAQYDGGLEDLGTTGRLGAAAATADPLRTDGLTDQA